MSTLHLTKIALRENSCRDKVCVWLEESSSRVLNKVLKSKVDQFETFEMFKQRDYIVTSNSVWN